jgi:radical SAM protein with 4Fe4S-binding SPASM domain
MRLAELERLIDEIKDFAKTLVMNFAGEPLINPQLAKMVAYAESNGIRVVIGTNGTRARAEALVAAGLSEILFALDGATDASSRQYRTYRDGSDHAKVVGNLERLIAAKRARAAAKPTIVLQFVVFKHNQHEIEDIIALGQAAGVDAIDFKTVCINDFFARTRDALIQTFAPTQWAEGTSLSAKPAWCSFSFHQTQILWNGDVTSCCDDYDGQHVVGNVVSDGGFKAVWRGARYRGLRRRIVMQSLEACRTCDETLTRPTRLWMTQPESARSSPGLASSEAVV